MLACAESAIAVTATDRQAIRRAFAGAAECYDAVAHLQRGIAQQLLTLTPAGLEGCLLDAGTGTGFGLRMLQACNPAANVIALDHAYSMLRIAGSGVCADIEALPLNDHCLDLYWSSLAWQWATPAHVIREAARSLKPGGLLRVATLGPDTLHELRAAFSAVDQARHTRHFTSPDTYVPLLSASGFTQIRIERHMHTRHAPALRSLLQELRNLGASHVGAGQRRGLMSRQAWQKLEAAYEAQRQPVGLPLSYDAVFISAIRQ